MYHDYHYFQRHKITDINVIWIINVIKRSLLGKNRLHTLICIFALCPSLILCPYIRSRTYPSLFVKYSCGLSCCRTWICGFPLRDMPCSPHILPPYIRSRTCRITTYPLTIGRFHRPRNQWYLGKSVLNKFNHTCEEGL